MNCITLQDDVVVSKGLNGSSTRGFRGHLFLLDQRLVITRQQSEHKTFQYIDDIAVSDGRVSVLGGACQS